jgi:glycosyltransferase involved in cell wall biosynthesis
MALGGSIVEPGLLARVWEMLHRWALRRATRVIVLGEDMRARIISKGVAPDRVAIVRDGVELPPASCSASELDAEVIRTIRSGYRFVLLHAGNLGFYGAWETLLAAARELAEDGVSLVFVGDGAQRSRLEAAAAGSTNVRFFPFFPTHQLASVLSAADAHVVTIKRGLEGVVVPSKLYGVLAAGRPIVAVAPQQTDAASLAARDGFGVSSDPDNPAELVAIVRTLLGDPRRLAAMGSAAQLAAARYARPKEALKFMQVLEDANQP